MKTFNLEMVDSGGNMIIAVIEGHGEVSIKLAPVNYDMVAKLRKHAAKRLKEAQGDDVVLHNDVAVELVYELTVDLVCKTVGGDLNRDQASQLLSKTGGVKGKLAKALAVRYGVADIWMNDQAEDEGLEDEIPT